MRRAEGEYDRRKCEEFLQANMLILKDVFNFYASLGSCYPCIGSTDFRRIVDMWGILENEKTGYFKMVDVDVSFAEVNYDETHNV